MWIVEYCFLTYFGILKNLVWKMTFEILRKDIRKT